MTLGFLDQDIYQLTRPMKYAKNVKVKVLLEVLAIRKYKRVNGFNYPLRRWFQQSENTTIKYFDLS